MQKRTTIFRAASMLGGLSAVVVGATFALTPVTATLTDSSLTAVTAGLVVDGPDANSDFGQDDPGFTYKNLFPGSANWSAPQTFSLKNNGTTDLKVAISTVGTTSGTLDKTKVHLRVKNVSENKTTEYVLSDLNTAVDLPGVSGTDVLTGNDEETVGDESETNNFTVEVKLDEGAAGTVGDLDFLFTGTPQDETVAPV